MVPGTNLGAAVSATLTAHLKIADLILLATVTGGAPPATAGLFAPGALCIRTDTSSGAAIYKNDGTTASPSWSLIDAIAAAEIALTDGRFLVGNASNVAAAVLMSGDATMNNAGAVTVASMGGVKIRRGVASITGSGTVVTGLATVVSVVATAQDDLDGDSLAGVSATIGDQAGAPAAGSVILKAWKVTTGGAAGNPTLIAATAAKSINWIAIGT